MTGIDLKNGAGITELTRCQEHFHEYKIMVYAGLNCDSVIVPRTGRLRKAHYLLFDEITQHCHGIANLTGAMAKRYLCEACNKVCRYDVVHTCEQTCSDCMASPPCVSAGIRIPYDLCNRHFMSQACFDNHK